MSKHIRKIIFVFALCWSTVMVAAQFPIVLEAENAKLFGELKIGQVSGFSGGKYTHDFHINSDSYFLYESVEVDQAGTYEFKVFSTGTARPFYIKVNEYERTVMRTADSPDWNAPPTSTTSSYIYLDAGVNTIKIGTEFENGPNIDKFEIHRTTAKLDKPNKVAVVFPYDFTDEAIITAEAENETLPFLTDNDENTYYEVNGVDNTTITVDCKEQKVLTAILLYADKGVDATGWIMEYSVDGNSWKRMPAPASTRMLGMGNIALFTYNRTSISKAYSARYYRLKATGTGKIRIGEWQLFGYTFDLNSDKPYFPSDVTDGLILSKQVSGFPEGGGNENLAKLFDKQLTTKYCCTTSTSFYVQCVLDKAYKFDSYTVVSANDASERDPKLWSLSGYNPEEGWVELDERRDFSFPGRYTAMTFPINSDKEFTAFMLEVSGVRSGNMVQLANLQVFGKATGNPAVAPELPSQPSADPKEHAAQLVRLMTKSEKLSYVGGVDWMYTRAIPRLGIPQMKMSDGPQGVGTWGNSTAYPCGICLASTWNEDLAHSYGEALALDCRANGVNILLGPAVNIHRAPMCGRNFEYMGEDPYLTSRTAVGYVKGLQGNGVMAVIKHFTANFQEYNRNYISSDIDERTLNEIYFPAFKAAVQEAKIGSVMSSYNLLNGTWTTHHPWLLRTVLRDQWGFDGILMSDWGSTHYCLPAAKGGLDLEMAGGERMSPDSLRYFIKRGDLGMDVIDEKVQHILQTMIKFGFKDNKQLDPSIPKDNPVCVKTALNVAREGVVLLKNENGLLPLKFDKIKKVAVVGQNALIYLTGGGSGRVSPIHYTSFYEGIRAIGAQKGIEVKYVDEYDHLDDKVYVPGTQNHGFKGEYFNNVNLSGNPVATKTVGNVSFNFQNGVGVEGIGTSNYSMRWTADLRPSESGQYVFHLGGDDGFRLYINGNRVIDDWTPGQERYRTYQMSLSTGQTYSIKVEYYQGSGAALVDLYWTKVGAGDYLQTNLNDADVVIACFGHTSSSEAEAGDRTFELPTKQRELINKVLSATQTPVIGVVTAGGNVEMQSWESHLKGLLWAWYPGQEGGTALGEILFGDVNPSGKLPVTFEKRWADNPTYSSYYDSDNDKHVEFTEGVFMGYRGYDKSGKTVQYPFGYGLSYTTFNLSQMTVEAATQADAILKVTCDLKNTGKVGGAQVVQLYVGKKGSSKVERPLKELKAFKKVYLEPEEAQTVTFYLTEQDFSFYDVDETAFVMDEGNYEISIGFSAGELPLKQEMTVKNTTGIGQVTATNELILRPTVVKAGDPVMICSGIASKVDVYNTAGVLKASYHNSETIPTIGFAKGMYLVRMNMDEKCLNGKFIVK